ncbi:hypothetical protein CUMW_220420 [Citrus unshiu]|uniref:ABC transporter domain-containing protein n=1 Tax=Citrus unshiu TaxID=55188 RepID=A0A2H5QDW0_CITUN|nr:hypothetical protein CUMW_220420 [Citrus unshiu]
MTVRETLAFSARCQGVGSRYEMLAELTRREKAAGIKPDPDIDVFMKAAATEGQEVSVITDYILKILGLDVCADTMVGDEILRGISGGQRKRVTTGEMLAGPAQALFMDEISNSTTFQIVNSLRQFIHILEGTILISLLQPAPETYDLFDDFILISNGHIVYQGPREYVLEFFKFMGFECPKRKGVADFLQEVTSQKEQQQYWAREEEPYRFGTVKGFTDTFKSFYLGKKLEDELRIPFDKRKSHRAALTTKIYGVSEKQLLESCMSRELLPMKRNSFVYIFKLSQLSIMALVAMTLFFRTKMHRDSLTDGGIYIGALFFVVNIIMFNDVEILNEAELESSHVGVLTGAYLLTKDVTHTRNELRITRDKPEDSSWQNSYTEIPLTLHDEIKFFHNRMSEISMTIAKLPVFYKQRDLRFYPSWAYALPAWILKIPISYVEVSVWVFLTYYVVGFDPNAGRFLKQYLLLLFLNQMTSALFRLVAATGRNMVVANTFGSFTLLLILVLGGFVLSREDIKKWWKWAYWCSPLMYAQNAIAVNEFLGNSWRKFVLIPAAFGKNQAVISEESQSNEHDNRIGGTVQLSTNGKSGHDIRRTNSTYLTEADTRANHHQKRGMVLPFEPHSITFDDITYSVDMPQEMINPGVSEDQLVLLNGVSGAFRPGVLTALMGVSGAGKTTLMDVLAGYCEQNDIHSPNVTVYESLLYSAWLRLPPEVDSQTRKMFIEEVMELVELNTLRQALVGLPGLNGLSTEKRKRLTIAVELVANPSIIFMDEPTSGLDARAAAIVMRTVRNTVDTGRTVVCTIHQPSIDIFEAFDELFLMKRGGQEIYVGPLGEHSSHLIKYFEGIPGVSTIKDGYNPATWMLEITTPSQETSLGIDFAGIYKSSELYRRNKELIKDLSKPAHGSKDLHFATQYAQSFFTQCMVCLWKQHWSYWRNPSYNAVRFLFTTVIALAFGTMFWDIGTKITKKQDLFNAMGSMYVAVLFLGVKNASSVQPVVSVERTVFYRERAAGLYSAFPYAFAQVLIEIPYIFVQAVTYGVLVYAMIGFEWTATKFFWYLFFVFFTLLYFTFYGMMAVAMTPNYHISAIIVSSFNGLWNVFSGYIIPRTRIPLWWRWYYWACPISWTLYGLVASQFGDKQDRLESGETVEQFLSSYFGFRHDFLGVVAAVVGALPVLFALIFAVGIKAKLLIGILGNHPSVAFYISKYPRKCR